MKTDVVQLILASAVIPMPGACVLPTTTWRSSAAAADGSGRCRRLPRQPRRRFKGETSLQVTRWCGGVGRGLGGHGGLPESLLAVWLFLQAGGSCRVWIRGWRGEEGTVGGVASSSAHQLSHLACPWARHLTPLPPSSQLRSETSSRCECVKQSSAAQRSDQQLKHLPQLLLHESGMSERN